MASKARLHLCDDIHSPRTDISEWKVIPGLLDEEFTEVKQIDKNTGSDTQLIRAKTKTSMTQRKGRTQRGITEHESL